MIDRGSILGAVAVALVAINTFGGFLVTERMLEMFKKKDPDPLAGGQAGSRSDRHPVPERHRAHLSRGERAVHPRPQGSLQSAHGTPRQPLRHRRDDASPSPPRCSITRRIDLTIGALAVGGLVGWLVARRVADDADAGARRGDALAGRPGGGAHRDRRRQQPRRVRRFRIPIPAGNRVELFIGTFVGAMTFSGSVIAFGKLAGLGKMLAAVLERAGRVQGTAHASTWCSPS